jgi:hypothetical protein
MSRVVAVRCRVLRNGSLAARGDRASARRTAGRTRLALLALAASAAVLALSAASAQASPSHTGPVGGPDAVGPATVDSESASNVGSTTAELDTQINPSGADTTCTFEYVDDTDFQSTGFTGPNVVSVACDPKNLGSATTDVGALADISGLAPNTTYDFQAVAQSSQGTVDGGPAQFTSSPPASIDSQSASNVGPQSAELDVQINPEGTDTTCQLQYVDDADFQSSGFTGPNVVTVPCNPDDLGAGVGDVAALADITGLTPSTTYDFRAVATNTLVSAGLDGPDAQFATTAPVSVDSESATNVTDTSARLNAELNPNGLDATYQFQYVTDAAFKATGYASAATAPASPVDIGSGTTDQPVAVDLTGLKPATKYHFRVTATNSAGSVSGNGTDETFTTYASAQPTGLPDRRGYEIVTPVNKDDGDPYIRAGIFGGFLSDVTGDGFTYPSLYAFPGSQSDGIPYLATRGSSGWTSTNMIPPQSTEAGGLCSAYESTAGWSTDMSKGILLDGQNQANGCGTDDPLLVPGTTAGGLPLCSATPLVTPCSGEQPGVQNIFVHDNTHGSYQLVSNLESAPSGTTPSDAIYAGGSSDLSHVVFSENAQLTSDAPSGDDLYEWVGGTVSLVTEVPATGTSCSGSACTPVVGSLAGGAMGTALHAVSADGSTIFFTANGNLYARENGSSTVQVDAGIGGSGEFQAASADGSKVFFTDSTGGNLYEYDLSTSSSPLTDLTPGGGAQVDGLSGLSDDGSLVYFVANSALASNANGDGQTAQTAQPNLYVVKTATAGDPITFLATLGGSDSCDWSAGCLTARVSSNGSYVAFTSTSALTNYNNNGQPEIFLSDASADGPNCVSCIPSGQAATSGAGIAGPELSGINPASVNYLERYISDRGQVFFNTADALLPTATNDAQNVYEYEAGQLRLISTGTSSADSLYLDSTPSGNDVFFVTSQALVPRDIDGAYDIYDARVGGGFPVPPTPAPSCQGDTCQPPPPSPPAPPVAGSVTFVGPGNAAPGHTTAATIRLLKRTVKGATIALRVKVPASGRITISGAEIKKVSRSVSHAGTYTLTVHLTGKAKNRLKHKRKLKLAFSVRYVPSAGGASTAQVKLTAKA